MDEVALTSPSSSSAGEALPPFTSTFGLGFSLLSHGSWKTDDDIKTLLVLYTYFVESAEFSILPHLGKIVYL